MTVSGAIRLGIVGFGRVARHAYVPALRALDEFKVRVVADPDEGARELAARAFPQAELLGDAIKASALGRVDAWLVASPPSEHREVVLAALHDGAHVYVEKPLTLQFADAQELVDAARAADRIAMVGYVGRFAEPYVELKRRLARLEGTAGASVRTRLSFDERVMPTWKRLPETGGGALRDIAGHHADLVRFLFDTEILAVRASVYSQRTAADTAQVELRLANAAVVFGTFSSADVACDSVTVRWGGKTLRAARVPRRSLPQRLGAALFQHRAEPTADPAFVACFAAFARAIRVRSSVRPTMEDGARGVAFACAAERSVRLGGWQSL